jgi:hypothetical protein
LTSVIWQNIIKVVFELKMIYIKNANSMDGLRLKKPFIDLTHKTFTEKVFGLYLKRTSLHVYTLCGVHNDNNNNNKNIILIYLKLFVIIIIIIIIITIIAPVLTHTPCLHRVYSVRLISS